MPLLTRTWTVGAKLPHILKYVQSYRVFYPSATQIIVRSEPASFWSSDKAKVKKHVYLCFCDDV